MTDKEQTEEIRQHGLDNFGRHTEAPLIASSSLGKLEFKIRIYLRKDEARVTYVILDGLETLCEFQELNDALNELDLMRE